MSQIKLDENMSKFQEILDDNKDKLSEGDYLKLCNSMKAMFEEHKDETNMTFCKVRIMTTKTEMIQETYRTVLRFRNEIINVRTIQLEKIKDALLKNDIVCYKSDSVVSTIYTPKKSLESTCERADCDCDDCKCDDGFVEMPVTSGEYITHVYPQNTLLNTSFTTDLFHTSKGLTHVNIR
jgi:hypothetical protein